MKLRNKLILSCAALAACATTMVSTTFAWYTSNTDVSANKVTANSSATGSDALLVSLTGEDGTWGTTVDLSTAFATTALIPLSYGNDGNGTGGSFYKLDSNGTTANQKLDSVTTGSKEYVTFDLYFKNTAATTSKLYLKTFTIDNTTSGVIEKDILTDPTQEGQGFTLKSNSNKPLTYAVDMLRATNMIVASGMAAEKGSISTVEKTVIATPHDAGYVDILDSTFQTNKYATSINAHDYYKTFMGKDLGKADKLLKAKTLGSGGAAVELADLAAANITKATFTFYLNGWDLECFDACQGQKFEVTLGFTTLSSSALKYNA